MLNRVTVDFGGDSQYGMSVEELLSDQRSRPDFSPALLEKIFEMGRHWFILNSGKYPSIAAEINATINLQTAGAVQGGLREGMEAYFNWMESLAPDCRANAKNIFGFRGAVVSALSRQGDWRQFLLQQRLTSLALLDFRRRLARAPVLGPLPGHRRPGFPPQPRRTGLQRPGAFLRGFPDGHRQEWELHLRPILLAGEQCRQHEPVGTGAGQCHNGYCGVPGSPDQFNPGFRNPGHRRRQRGEMEGNAGQDAALPARTGRHPQGMGLAHVARALQPSARLSSLRRLARR